VGKTLQDGDEVVLQRTDGAAVRCACQARQLRAHGDAPPVGQARTVVDWDTPLALSTSAEFPMEAAHGPGAVPWACTACFEPHAVGRLREALRLGLHGAQAELHELGLERPSVIHLSGPAGRALPPPRAHPTRHARAARVALSGRRARRRQDDAAARARGGAARAGFRGPAAWRAPS
jgi:hypothetical protein